MDNQYIINPLSLLAILNFSFCFHYISLWKNFLFVSFRFVSFRLISFCFVSFRFVLFRFVSFRLISFRFVRFRFISFHLASFLFRFALYRYPEKKHWFDNGRKLLLKLNIVKEFKFILYKATPEFFLSYLHSPIWNMLTSYGIIRHCSNCSNWGKSLIIYI